MVGGGWWVVGGVVWWVVVVAVGGFTLDFGIIFLRFFPLASATNAASGLPQLVIYIAYLARCFVFIGAIPAVL